jgi:large subunit ribosomal protein L24
MAKIKKGDEVIVIAGKSKGQTGKVDSVTDGKVVVEGVNLVKKHVKPNPQAGIQGGIISKPAALDISNVAIYNSASQKADRVGYKVEDGKKVRIYKSTGETI